jgi:hypothetical protein
MTVIAGEAFEIRHWDASDGHPAFSQPHLRPLLGALDHGIRLIAIPPLCGAFVAPLTRQAIVVIFDGLSLGPQGFDESSIRVFLKRCEGPTLIASANPPGFDPARMKQRERGLLPFFKDAAESAISKRASVLVIETTPEQHGNWCDVIRRISPRLDGSYNFTGGAA